MEIIEQTNQSINQSILRKGRKEMIGFQHTTGSKCLLFSEEILVSGELLSLISSNPWIETNTMMKKKKIIEVDMRCESIPILVGSQEQTTSSIRMFLTWSFRFPFLRKSFFRSIIVFPDVVAWNFRRSHLFFANSSNFFVNAIALLLLGIFLNKLLEYQRYQKRFVQNLRRKKRGMY